MKSRLRRKLLPLSIVWCCSVIMASMAPAQNLSGRWSIGAHAGPNLWVTEMTGRKVGFGGELVARYGVERWLAVGGMVGYERLKSNQVPTTTALPYDYIRLKAIPVAAMTWLYASGGSAFTPYAYFGIGAMFYKRQDGLDVYIPDDSYKTSILIPLGVGFEMFAARSVSFSLDFGFKLLDGYTAANLTRSQDFYSSVKLGASMYFGSSDDDDADLDGLTNAVEAMWGTDPRNPDTDEDGLKDGDEVNVYRTDPLAADTDGDGLSDTDEISKYQTDPLRADSDGDGLNDGDEIRKYQTDPLKADTDGDGLSDGEEVLKYGTDPLRDDSDGDNVVDGEEVYRYKTNPLKADTDGGGIIDGDEIHRGTDPLDPNDDGRGRKEEFKLEIGQSIVLEGVIFEPISTQLSFESEEILAKVYTTLMQNPAWRVEVRGYTDNVGTRTSNMRLSQQRANVVRAWLVEMGIDQRRIIAKGFGQENPIVPNTTMEGRQKNRRMELYRVR